MPNIFLERAGTERPLARFDPLAIELEGVTQVARGLFGEEIVSVGTVG